MRAILHGELVLGRNRGTSRGKRSDDRRLRGRWTRVLREEYSPSLCCTQPSCCTRSVGWCGCPPARRVESPRESFSSSASLTVVTALSFGFAPERREMRVKERIVGWSARLRGRNVPHCLDEARTKCQNSCVGATTTRSEDEPGPVGKKHEVLPHREVPGLYQEQVLAHVEPGLLCPLDSCHYPHCHRRLASSRSARSSPSPCPHQPCKPRTPRQTPREACWSKASLENIQPLLQSISCGTDLEAI